jgi:hypothetical protein
MDDFEPHRCACADFFFRNGSRKLHRSNAEQRYSKTNLEFDEITLRFGKLKRRNKKLKRRFRKIKQNKKWITK